MGPLGRRGRRRGLIVGAAVGTAVGRSSAQKNAQPAADSAATPQPVSDGNDQQFAQLEQLAKLKDQGILTQEEFDAKKKQILGL
jgi:Short C-terminal domain